MKTFLRYLMIGSVVALLLAGGGLWYYMNGTYSEGERAGRLIKLSYKGFLIKTWEGQLDVGGLSGGAGGEGLTSLWDFSVSYDKDLIEKLKAAQGKMVRLHYEERFVRLFWRGDTKYFITGVELIQ